jgi:DNA-binding LacI/PurR family transcriptional regulator
MFRVRSRPSPTSTAGGSTSEAVPLKAVLETRHCDAIILLGDMRDHPRVLAELDDARVPSVSLGRGPHRDDGMPSIDVDNPYGIWSVMDYLVGLGHESIAYIGARPDGDFPSRREAYTEFMRQHGLRIRRRYDRHMTNNARGGATAFEALNSLPVPPTAFVAATDVLAIGALNAAYRAAMNVPVDVSVTGFGDLAIAGFTVPPLTTVRMPSVEMATAAVAAAIALAAHGSPGAGAPTSLTFRPELVIRESCAPREVVTGSRVTLSPSSPFARDPTEAPP